MRLDRNANGDGNGKQKYALLKLRNVTAETPYAAQEAIAFLDKLGLIDWGRANEADEFFVIKLRDAFAEAPLVMYANAAMLAGEGEYARDVKALADRAGGKSPFCKRPD